MLRRILLKKFNLSSMKHYRTFTNSTQRWSDNRDSQLLKDDIQLTGIHLDDIDDLMGDEVLKSISGYYPKLTVDSSLKRRPVEGHNLIVIQPWINFANFDEFTDPNLQLAECVSLGNTIKNWRVIAQKIIFAKTINKKEVFGKKGFEEFKEFVFSHEGASAIFFGVELLSGVQLSNLERGLKMPCFDRFTMVLNIFRQHARTKEAKIQVALAELPYIRSHLREIHESTEFSSSTESLKMLVGGMGEKFYHQRLNILKKREGKLRKLLADIRSHREMIRRQRKRHEIPIVSVVGYTNSGKTAMIKYLTQDENLCPKDQLFATLDVTCHHGQLRSNKDVLYFDTVGFLSRIPTLLIEAFSATLQEVQDSSLIIHVLDVNHPDCRLQYATVMKALGSLNISKKLLQTKITVGNKFDLFAGKSLPESINCDFFVSATTGLNMPQLVAGIDKCLKTSLNHQETTIRVDNGGKKFQWLRRYSTILDCKADENDVNYLICRVIMNESSLGRWRKSFGLSDVLTNSAAFQKNDDLFGLPITEQLVEPPTTG